MTVGSYSVYKRTRNALKSGGIESPALEATSILHRVYGVDKLELLADKAVEETAERQAELESIVSRRISGEPLQYLVGEWEFYGFPFCVGEGVLIPRADTEVLVEAALSEIRGNMRVADLCSGSGCVAVALKKLRSDAEVTAIELSDEAYPYLLKNIEINKVDIKPIKGDVTDSAFTDSLPWFDVITANPPYLTKADMENLQREVSFEPRSALYGGIDGLDMYRKITRLWRGKIKTGGKLIYEIGMGQEQAVASILEENGFKSIELKRDLNKIIRVICAEKAEVK